MAKATQPRCPECGSKNIRSVDSVLVTNPITGWDVNPAGVFEPADFAGGEVCWARVSGPRHGRRWSTR